MAEQNKDANIETNTGNTETTNGEGAGTQQELNTPSTEEMLAQLAATRAEAAKNKAALDKALKETGELKKSLRAKQTAEEQAAELAKEEEEQRQAYVTELETYKRTNEAEKRYSLQGMSSEMAAEAAKAEIDGDMDALSDIQKRFTAQLLRENDAKWMKQTPQPSAGGQYQSMTREQIMAITDPDERRKAIAANLDIFGY